MGKQQNQPPLQQQPIEGADGCATCPFGIGGEFNLKCVVVLIFSLAVFIYSVFWLLPHRTVVVQSRYDASEDIKLKASVQAVFRLQKPVSVLVPYIDRLEYDIFGELEVPSTKVYILSMCQVGTSDWTKVVFGILPDPIYSSINPVCLDLLRSSLIDLFLKESNLTLTSTIFGQPTTFEIAKFPGGITVLPKPTSFISLKTQIYFDFMLNNSIKDIKDHIVLLKEELRSWLRLRPYENVFVQVTNKNGSTTKKLINVKAGVISVKGHIHTYRLKQLARRISYSPPSTNLGLNNTVFGKVKGISLSSYLNHTLHPTPPISPAPAPAPSKHDGHSPFYPSALSPPVHSPRCGSRISPSPSPSLQISPTSPSRSPFVGLSPSPLASSSLSPSSSSSDGIVSINRIWVRFYGLLTLSLLLWG